jgi:HK97 family phage portal protein
MSLMRAIFGSNQAASDPNHWIVRAVGSMTAAGVTVNETLALNLPAVYACVNRIANPLSSFPIGIFRPDADGRPVRDDAHPLNKLLNRQPNPYMNQQRMRKTAQSHACLWGNAYIEIQRDGANRPVALWPLMAWDTSPHKSDSGEVRIRTRIDGSTFSLPLDSVLHVADISLDGYCGLSVIHQARAAVGLAQAAETFGSKFFGNDARSGGFLMYPGKLGEKGRRNLGDSVNAREDSGLENAHRIRILEEGTKFVPTQIPPDDAQFLATREFQIGEIARIYNVPLFLLQHESPGTVWGTGMEQMMLAFIVHTLDPWVTAWEAEFNNKLFTEREREHGYYVKFNMAALLRGDMAARAQFYASGIDAGWMLPSEAREKEDLPFIEDLDTVAERNEGDNPNG